MSTRGCPVFTFSLPGAVARPLSPCQLRHCRRGATVYSKHSISVLWMFIDMVSSLQQEMGTWNQWISVILWRPY